MKEEIKALNITAIKGRLECAKEVWMTVEDNDPYKKELEEEIRFLERLLRYSI